MDNKNLIEQNITDTLELNYMPYAMSVIISRAIPEIDGFKPAHRKLLYTMFKMGLLNGPRTKSTNVVGQTMKLNPHGDAAIYETLVRLTRGNDALLHPFIDSKGNFGKQYSKNMAYAASRYTEVKLDSICSEIFKNIDKNTVDFIDNYDGEMKEPVLLPTTFPNILATPNQGIAVSMASSICSFNLKEICAATTAFIKNENTDIKKYLKAPDFTTGGELIYDEDEIDKIYNTGRGSFKVRGKYRFDKKNSIVEIYEIPYTTSVEAIIDKVISLVKAGKLKEINDIRDETDLDGLKIAIDIKKNADVDMLMHKISSMTPFTDSFSANFNILVNGSPKTMGIKGILKQWLGFRTECIKRQTAYDLDMKADKLHLLEGLEKIIIDIDKAIKIIRQTPEERLVVPNLMEGFGIDEVQAEYIAEIKLRNINKEFLFKRIEEKHKLMEEIKRLNDILKSDELVKDIIIAELKEVSKKYGKARKTDIIFHNEIPQISQEQFIEDYPIKLFLTRHNYFKKITLASLRSASEHKLKQEDEIIQELETSNKTDILFFSDKFNVYKAKAYELNECKASSIGDYLNNLLELEADESIIYICATVDYSGYMIFGFENGKIAKVSMQAYYTKVNRKRLVNAYSSKSRLIFISFIKEDCDFIVIRDNDKAMMFNTALLNEKITKSFGGVQVFALKKNSSVTKIIAKQDFLSDDEQYYRSDKIPSAGHFINEDDKIKNGIAQKTKLL